jgi:hypothetical protein
MGICMTVPASGGFEDEFGAHQTIVKFCAFVTCNAWYRQMRTFQRIICFLMSFDIELCGNESVYIMTLVAFSLRFSGGELTAMIVFMAVGALGEIQAIKWLPRLVALVTGYG